MGEIKIPFKDSGKQLRQGIVMDAHVEGTLSRFDVCLVSPSSSPILKNVDISLYSTAPEPVPLATLIEAQYETQPHIYAEIEPQTPTYSEVRQFPPIPPRRPPGMLPSERDPNDPTYALVRRR